MVNEYGTHLAFLPDETGVIYSSFNELNLWDFQNRKSVPLKFVSKTDDDSEITGLWVDPTPSDANCISVKIFQKNRLSPLAYHPDEKRIEVFSAIPLEGKESTIFSQCVFSPDGTRALCFDESTAELGLLDTQTGKLVFQPDWNKLFNLPEPSKDFLLRAVKFSPDGKYWGAAVGGRAFTHFPDTVFVWETGSDTVFMSWKPDSIIPEQTSEIERIALSRSDSKRPDPILAVSSSVNYPNVPVRLSDFTLIEIPNRRVLEQNSGGLQTSTIEFSPQDGTYIESYCNGKTAIIEIKTVRGSRKVRTIQPPYYDVVKNPVVQNISISPSGKLFAVTINYSTLIYSSHFKNQFFLPEYGSFL